MNPERLKELIENPDSITSEHTSEIEELVRTYPYFQAAKVLLAKATGNSEAIKSAAVITADRTILMRVINGTFDQDLNMPNLNDLEIDAEVNAFNQLQEEEETQEQEETEDTASDEVNALLDSFEEEAEKEETEVVSDKYQQEEEEKEETIFDENETSLKDKGLSDFSTEDYKLPDYNYNFDADDSDVKDSDLETKEEESELDWGEESSDDENTFKDFKLEDLHNSPTEEEQINIASDTLESEDEDKFRNELMESLADLNRIRKENADKEEIAEAEQKAQIANQVTKEETADEKIEEPVLEHDEKALFEEDNTEKTNEINSYINGSAENTESQKHLTNNFKEPETTSEDNLMFDDNLFELNHLISTEKKETHANKVGEGVHVQKEVIDRFINTIPELTAQDHERREYSHLARDLYDKSVHVDTSKMTETMAKLMITQGKLPSAIEIYEHLMLKYPEKKAYFASLIEKIRKDI